MRRFLKRLRKRGASAHERREAWRKRRAIFAESGLFDREWYLARNPDLGRVGRDPLDHFAEHGALEGRDPGPGFQTAYYAEQIPSFAETGLSAFEHYLRYGRDAGIVPVGASPYAQWVERFAALTDEDMARIEADAWAFPLPATLCVHVLRRETEAGRASAAVEGQIGVRPAFGAVRGREDLAWVERTLADLPDGAVVILAAGDARLRRHAAYCFASVLARGAASAAYCDHDHETPQGERTRPVFKPQMSPTFMAQMPYAGPVVAVRLSADLRGQVLAALTQALGSEPETAFATLLLEAGTRRVERLPLSLYALPDDAPPDADELRKVYEVMPANLKPLPAPPLADPPRVSILIPTRDRRELLEECVSSILAKTDYPRDRFRIVVIDNDSREEDAVAYLASLSDDPSCQVVPSPGPFNFSKICNDGAAASDGEILVFLNNDITVIAPDWLTTLVAHAVAPDAGAVGAKLLYPDDTVQHGGVVLGVMGVGAHRLVRFEAEECEAFDATREMTAVTGACLALRRSAFEAVGGFDPILAVAFNDAALCMRLFEAGYRNVYVARALLYHHESKSRGYDDSRQKQAINRREAIYVRMRHGALFRDDPSYNPNLSLQRIGDLGVPPRLVLPWRRSIQRPRVLILSSAHGIGHGVACVVGMQAEHFMKRGWDVAVGGVVGDRDRDYPGCRRVDLVTELQAASFAVAEGYDCVIAHTPPFFSLARYLGSRPLFYIYDHGEPPPVLFEDREARELVDWEKRFCAPLAQRVFAISETIYREQYRTDATVLRNGNTHLSAWRPTWAAQRAALRRKFGFEGRFVILNVCRFHASERRYKGVDLFASLAAESRYIFPDLAERGTFVLVGRGDEEDVAYLRDAGLTVFPNVTDGEMAELYAASDLYVSLSQWEGYNLGIGQALAMGLPAIASDIPAHREFGIPTSNAVPKLCALVGEALSRWDEAAGSRTARLEPWDVPLTRLADMLEEDIAADRRGRWLSGRDPSPLNLPWRLGRGRRAPPPAPVPAEVPPPDRPFAIARFDTCLADLSPEDLRALIADLNGRSDAVGCAVFRPPGEHDCVATIFAGNLERFFMVAAARNLRCPVVYIQDPISYWYQGSPLLPDLDTVCRRVVIPETGLARALLFGQSSGGYAALAASAWLPGATVVACAPQTFSDAGAKGRISFVGIRAHSAPEGLIALQAHLAGHRDPDALRAVVIAAGELDNPAHTHWWGDYLHMLRLIDVPGTDLFVVNANTHVLAHGRVNDYARLLADLAAETASPPARRTEVVRAFLTELYGQV